MDVGVGCRDTGVLCMVDTYNQPHELDEEMGKLMMTQSQDDTIAALRQELADAKAELFKRDQQVRSIYCCNCGWSALTYKAGERPDDAAYQAAVEAVNAHELVCPESALVKQLATCRAALSGIMPFIMEEYYPNCATPEFKAAVEVAQAALAALESK